MWIQTQSQSSHSYPTKPTAMSPGLQTPVSKLHPWGPTRPLSLENSTEGMHTCPMLPLTPLCWGEDWGGLDSVPASPTAACRPSHPPHFAFGHPLTHCGVARAWTLLLQHWQWGRAPRGHVVRALPTSRSRAQRRWQLCRCLPATPCTYEAALCSDPVGPACSALGAGWCFRPISELEKWAWKKKNASHGKGPLITRGVVLSVSPQCVVEILSGYRSSSLPPAPLQSSC